MTVDVVLAAADVFKQAVSLAHRYRDAHLAERALDLVPLEVLKQHAWDASPSRESP